MILEPVEPEDGEVYCELCDQWVDYRVYGTIGCVECEADLEEAYYKD